MKRKFLTDLGVTNAEAIKQIIDYHQGVVGNLKGEIEKAQEELSSAKNKIEGLESKILDDGGLDWKDQFDKLKDQFDIYKENTEREKITAAKKATLHAALKADGANENVIELLESKFNIEEIEIEDGKIKGWEDLVRPVKERFSAVFGKIENIGINPASPPRNENNPYSGKTVYELMVEANSNPAKTEGILKQIEAMNKSAASAGSAG